MTQIYIAKKDGVPKYLVIDGEVLDLELATEAEGSEVPTAAPAKKPRKVKHGYTKTATRGRKPRSCSHCGQPGHQARTCPENAESEPTDEDARLAAANDPNDPTEMDDEEIERRVHEMQAEGMSSIAIAAKLRVSLKTVNQFWRNRTAELER